MEHAVLMIFKYVRGNGMYGYELLQLWP